MKVVILAGGYGTRLSELTEDIPKPMVQIGNKPIIIHIMERYAKYGYKDFIIALGFKGDYIKNYFSNLLNNSNDFTINFNTGTVKKFGQSNIDWNVSLIDTGLHSMTGRRLKKLKDYIGNSSVIALSIFSFNRPASYKFESEVMFEGMFILPDGQ